MGVAPFQLGDRVHSERLYAVAEVAVLFGVTRPTVYRWLALGRLIRVETLYGPKIPGYSVIELVQTQGRQIGGGHGTEA